MPSIIDSTLREGMQTPSKTWSVEQSVRVARMLVAAGVDMVECGHPAVGDSEAVRVAAVVRAVPDVPVLAHARAHVDDIAAVAKTGAAWVGIFLGVNRVSRSARLPDRNLDDLLALARSSVRHARELGLKVRFTVEDGGRTDVADLHAAFVAALNAGADRICLADTVGSLEPAGVGTLVADLTRAFPNTQVEVHLHDDRGLALANALAAVDNGATWISTSVNGLGERAGITDLAALCLNLHLRGQRPLRDGEILTQLSHTVAAFSRSGPDPRRPAVGAHVFTHSSALHVRAVERDPASYEVIDPAAFGRVRATSAPALPRDPDQLVLKPPVISATELRHHRAGPGERYVLIDDRFLPGAGQYCIARRVPPMADYGRGHVDAHRHACDSLFIFLGEEPGYAGLTVEVLLGEEWREVTSPAAVFIPAAVQHAYRVVAGSGTYLNHVLAGDYNSSLLDGWETWS